MPQTYLAASGSARIVLALVYQVAVVIPRDDLLVAQALAAHGRAEVVLEEVSLLLGGEDARLPLLRRHRLVLHRDAPDGYALGLISLDELRVVVGPRLIKLGPELPAVEHVPVVLHEGGRAPRAREEREPAARGRD